MPTNGNPSTPPPPDWRELAAKASKELDPNKLTSLVSELLVKLDEEQKRKKALAQSAISDATPHDRK
jgi:hypothetical protein